MARITVEDCLEKIGNENRFTLVHLTVKRVKQHRQGEPMLVAGRKNKEIVMTLREIAAGKVTVENINDLPALRRDAAVVNNAPVETAETGDTPEQVA